jgi:hypothetical protein
MLKYGFGFSRVCLLVKLDWDKISDFSNEIFKISPTLWFILFIAGIGFIICTGFVMTVSSK